MLFFFGELWRPYGYEESYAHLLSLVQGARAAQTIYDTRGIVLAMDGTTVKDGGTVCAYQEMLAALLAITLEADPHCNPALITQHFHFFAWLV